MGKKKETNIQDDSVRQATCLLRLLSP